ncbi:gamma-glutamyltranspeptidase 1-like [Brachionus plicatilis]|uniref:Gamma-glutamyltranspeptidase 1-like n=1 Tax=Brachionus plicatilis TaxID=10195 RepID=A0A3M7RPK9_BRAPC|nr:gamma-glutamyltranspeptidase 1-like [Brachionus plicatilis]
MESQTNGKDFETLNEYTSIRRDNLSFDATLDMGINSNDTPLASKINNNESDFLEINPSNLSENAPIRQSKYFASDSTINSSKELRQIIIGGIVFSVSITFALIIQILVGPSQIPNRVGIITQEKVCSDIGAEIVKKGGNSIDAFISSSLCLSVVNPFAAGLGAGGFLLVRDHKHEKDVEINCFFKSSSSAKEDDYEKNPNIGRKSIAIPGELKCLQYVYHNYARLYWNTLAEPAIKLALDGFKVSNLLARHLESIKDVILQKKDSFLAEIFLDETGVLVKEGTVIKNPYLARTIQSLVKKESNFYNGAKGKDLVNFLLEEDDYQITNDDLISYSEQKKSIETSIFNDFVLLTASYPSAGPALKFIIDSLSDLSINLDNIRSAETLAKILEASKMGYIFSSFISDPYFAIDQSEMFNQKLKLAKQYLQNRNDSSFPFEDKSMTTMI